MTVPMPASLTDHSLGEAALAWAAMSWDVFPIVPRGKTPYEKGAFCHRTDEHTCGFACATTDLEQIAAWWTAHPDSNIGITKADAFIVDEDRIGALVEAGVVLPKCPWGNTGRTGGGRHFFLRAPEGWDGLRGDDVKVTYKLAGVEAKGFGKGYVVAAPSIHATGTRYELQMGGYVPEASARILGQIVDVTPDRAPNVTSFITVGAGGYELPNAVGTGGRYEAIRSYVAHLYNREFSLEEMWSQVRSILAPTFSPRLSERDLRERFKRATGDMPKRLGAPRRGPTAPTPAVAALADLPLTEFDSRPVEWLWPSWLPRGVVTLMDGNPGVSKSTLVADLVARITTGRAWPDGTPALIGPSRAMWITTEDDPGRVLRPRIEAAGGDASLVRFVTSEVVFPQAKDAFRELLVARASEPLGLALVILDPLFSHIDAKVKSIADADMRQGVMSPLGDAAEAADLAILVVRHFSKDSAASALTKGAGSLGGITGAARAQWGVTSDPEDETGATKAVGVSKLNYAREPAALRYQVVDRVPPGWVTGSVSGIEWLGAAPVSIATMMAEHRDAGDAVKALEEILTAGPTPATAVWNQMKARGFGKDATKGAKQRLGVLTTKSGMTGGWVWSLPEEAEEAGDTPSAPSASSRGRARREGPMTHPFRPFEEAEEVGTGGAPRAGAREAPVLTLVEGGQNPTVTCHYFTDHQTRHRRLPDGRYVCPICSPEEAS